MVRITGSYSAHLVIGMGSQDWQGEWLQREDHPSNPFFPQPEQSLFRGGEYGKTIIVATEKYLKFLYNGNQDGKLHDVVEIMAPGVAPVDAVYGGKPWIVGKLCDVLLHTLLVSLRKNVAENIAWTRIKVGTCVIKYFSTWAKNFV